MTMTESGNPGDGNAGDSAPLSMVRADGPTVTNVRERVNEMTGGFAPRQKMTMGAAAVAVVVAVLGWSFFGSNPEMAPLMTDLNAEDASAVVAVLEDQGIAYELAAGGSTIMVPRDEVYQTRLDVASVDMPSSGRVGYGILDSQGMGASEFTQQVGYQRALEGEFASTIEAIDGVEAATVHLALPKNDTFALSEQDSTASVLVKTDGTSLSTGQTQAIVNLVASGVEGMDASDVTVADADGNVLASPGTGVSGGGMDSEALDDYEARVAGSIENMLVAVVGPGKVRSTVSAEIDFDQSSTVSETYSPPVTEPGSDPLTISESTRNETYSGTGDTPEGVLGVQGDETETDAGTEGGYELDERQSNSALDKTIVNTQTAPGAVERLSVAVIVDEEAVPADQLAEIETLVAQAAGIQPERGDTLAVSRLPFDTSVSEAQAEALAARDGVEEPAGMNPLIFAAAGVLLLLVILAAVFALKKKKKAADEDAEVLSLPAGLDGELGYAQRVADGELLSPELISLDSSSEARNGERQEVLGELIDNQPDEVAQLLRGWLGDRRESVR